MPNDVFISYSKSDAEIAGTLCQVLEKAGITCWIAPRNLSPGANFAVELLRAIDSSSAVVLVFSAEANASQFILTEINLAFSQGKAIFAFRTEDALPSADLEFYLARYQWVNGFPGPLETHAGHLAEAILAFLGRGSRQPQAEPAAAAPASGGHRFALPPVEPVGAPPSPVAALPLPPAEPVSRLPSPIDVFISAKSDDFKYAREVFAFLKSKGISVFLSSESLPELGNSDYRDEIDRALDQARHMVVVTSSRAHVESSYVKSEWGLFVNEKRSGLKKGNLVTLVAENLHPRDLPPSLRYYEVMPLQHESFERLIHYLR